MMLSEKNRPFQHSNWSWNNRAKPRICERCGEEYMPRSRTQRFCCKECRLKTKEERWTGTT